MHPFYVMLPNSVRDVTEQTLLNRDRPGLNRAICSSTSIIRARLNRLVPCKTVSPPVRNGAPPFVNVASGSLLRPVYHGRDTVDPPNEPVSPRRHPGLPRFLTSFPVIPVRTGCIKHFKTTGDMSRFNTVHPGSPRFSTMSPRL